MDDDSEDEGEEDELADLAADVRLVPQEESKGGRAWSGHAWCGHVWSDMYGVGMHGAGMHGVNV